SVGTIVFAGTPNDTLTYNGVQSTIDISGSTAANLVFNLPTIVAGTNNAFLEDDGVSGNNIAQLRSGNSTFPTTLFTNPTAAATISPGNSGDTLTVNNLLNTDFNPSLTIGSSANPFSTAEFLGGLTLGSGKNLSAFASALSEFTTGAVSVSGSGAISLT